MVRKRALPKSSYQRGLDLRRRRFETNRKRETDRKGKGLDWPLTVQKGYGHRQGQRSNREAACDWFPGEGSQATSLCLQPPLFPPLPHRSLTLEAVGGFLFFFLLSLSNYC